MTIKIYIYVLDDQYDVTNALKHFFSWLINKILLIGPSNASKHLYISL